MLYVGAATPTGSVENIGGLVDFPSTDASDIYETGVAVGLIAGAERYGFIGEVTLEFRDPMPLTDLGQSLANLSREDGKKVDTGYFSANVFVAKSFRVGERARPFAGVSAGIVDNQLTASGVSAHNDEGFGLAARGGVDLLPTTAWPLILRLGAKYEILSAGNDIPNDISYHLGVGWGFL